MRSPGGSEVSDTTSIALEKMSKEKSKSGAGAWIPVFFFFWGGACFLYICFGSPFSFWGDFLEGEGPFQRLMDQLFLDCLEGEGRFQRLMDPFFCIFLEGEEPFQ